MAQEVQKTQHVIYRSTNNQLIDIYYMREPNWRFVNHTVSSGAPSIVGKPSGFVYDMDNSQNVAMRGVDGHIYLLNFVRGRGWEVSNITASLGTPTATGDISTYTYHVFNTKHIMYPGSDGHLHQLYYNMEKGWRHADMTAGQGAPPINGKPSTYVHMENNSQNVIYRSQDGHIQHVYFVRGEGWHIQNVSASIGAPPAVSDPATYSYHVFNTQHVVYASADGHLHQLYYNTEKGWRDADMAGQGAPLMKDRPAPFVDTVDNSQSISYWGQDNHIYIIYFIRGEGWKHLNLSAMTGSPQAAGPPYAYTFDLFNSKHVVYRGVDGNIYQIYLTPGNQWRTSNLSVTTGAPQAAGDPSAYTYDLK